MWICIERYKLGARQWTRFDLPRVGPETMVHPLVSLVDGPCDSLCYKFGILAFSTVQA